jgi:inner membrane protein
MDNLTHSVAGLAIGELTHRCLPEEAEPQHQRTRRRLLLFTCWAASNFPDLDLVLTPLLPPPLGYLLHHRGHTHTLLYALPQALLLMLLILVLWPSARRLLQHSAPARSGFFMTLGAGFVLHIAMDFLNSYGVHPFHPFDSRWFYGDAVFILEPVFWMAFGVPMAMMLPGRALKILFMVLLVGVPAFFASRGFLGWTSLAALLAIAVSAAVLQHRAGERGKAALLFAIGVCACFIGVQHLASSWASKTVEQALRKQDAEGRMVDAAMTAFPSNPFCWTFVSVESKEKADRYVIRSGTVSAMPRIVPVSACPPALAGTGVPHQAAEITFATEDQGSLQQLRALRTGNCHVEAWLRFARAPVVNESTAYDARYATSQRGNFTTMELSALRDVACARLVPQWDFPRADLLGVAP